MAIAYLVEDGTGLAGATAYIAIADADQNFENTGRNTAWKAFTLGQRQSALVAAARYMDQVYGSRYLGDVAEATAETQGLLWPRDNVPSPRTGTILASTAIPAEIGQASAEFALSYLESGDGSFYGADDSQAQTVTEKTVRVEGAVMKSEKFGSGGATKRRRRYPLAEALLSDYVTAAQSRVIRA
jgi:hypothetical protein